MALRNQQLAHVLGLLSLFFLIMHKCHAFEFKVGGSHGWTVPSDPNASTYNDWAEKNRFQIGDSLLFLYSGDHDSVLRVTKEDYENCRTEEPLEKFGNGHTVYHFTQSGPHYFISGEADNCRKNEKLIVVVMADRTKRGSSSDPTSPPSEESSPPQNGVASVVAGAVWFGSLLVLAI